MKKIFSVLLCLISLVTVFVFDTTAIYDDEPILFVDNSSFVSEENIDQYGNATRATGLIYSYMLNLSKSGTTLTISGLTNCAPDVVKCGFKNLTVQRRKTSSDSWTDYYEFGNLYMESTLANMSKSLVVASGYQYRVTCKHYAKKSLLVTQSISNTSNIVTVS